MTNLEQAGLALSLNERLIDIREVQQITGMRKTTIYAWMKAGEFPGPVKLGSRCSRWPLSRVQQFVQERIAANDASPAGRKQMELK